MMSYPQANNSLITGSPPYSGFEPMLRAAAETQ